jgi:hypothetical protein
MEFATPQAVRELFHLLALRHRGARELRPPGTGHRTCFTSLVPRLDTRFRRACRGFNRRHLHLGGHMSFIDKVVATVTPPETERARREARWKAQAAADVNDWLAVRRCALAAA